MLQNKAITGLLIVAAVSGGVIGSLITQNFFITTPVSNTDRSSNELIRDFYTTENLVHVSPHSLRRKMDKGDTSFILVDVRSQEEYEKAHIIGAINIPAYKDPNTSIALETDSEARSRIIEQFRALSKDKEVIVYCYSIPCMTGRKIGKLLADEGVMVKTLGIGWNEWKYAWTSWNHELEWSSTKPEDYIQAGKEPGSPKVRELPSPCGINELSC